MAMKLITITLVLVSSTALAGTKIAVIDTGIDAAHPDLRGHVLTGWDFVDKKPCRDDLNGHGTHVAGIIHKQDPQADLLPLRIYSGDSTAAIARSGQAIWYAIRHGVKVINYSGGGPDFSEEEYLAIQAARHKGILMVAAAGNSHQDLDKPNNKYYPASYQLDNILVVGAVDNMGNMLPSSDYGKKVDVAAPGKDIRSDYLLGEYATMTGTSQATAYVTGIASALLEVDPDLTPLDIRRLIMAGSTVHKGLRVLSSGVADRDSSLELLHWLLKPGIQ